MTPMKPLMAGGRRAVTHIGLCTSSPERLHKKGPKVSESEAKFLISRDRVVN
jgi:hypothetical protein